MKWTKERRDKLSADDFVEPAHRLWPIEDESDLAYAAAHVGFATEPAEAKKRLAAIAARKGLKVPTQLAVTFSVEDDGKYCPSLDDAAAEFASDMGDVVERICPVAFKSATYEFKDGSSYEMTPEEIKIACQKFKPVKIDDNHLSTAVLKSGKFAQDSYFESKGGFGKAVEILPSADFSKFGLKLHVKKWVDQLHRDGDGRPTPIPLSCTFSPIEKQLAAVAMTPNPRITEAAMFAAFAAEEDGLAAEFYSPDQPRDDHGRWDETNAAHGYEKQESKDDSGRTIYGHESGRAVAVNHKTSEWEHKAAGGKTIGKGKGLESLNTHLAKHGDRKTAAFADEESAVTKKAAPAMKSPSHQKLAQFLHDHTAMAGAVCSGDNARTPTANFASESEMGSLQKMHDESCVMGAGCNLYKENLAKNRVSSDGVSEAMNRIPAFRSYHPEHMAMMSTDEAAMPTVHTPTAEETRLQAQLDRERQKSRKSAMAAVGAEAATFAAEIGDKLPPFVKNKAVDLYLSLASDDLDHATHAEFSGEANGRPSRAAAVKGLVAALADCPMTRELTPDDRVLFTQETTQTPDDAENTRLKAAMEEKAAKEKAAKNGNGKH